MAIYAIHIILDIYVWVHYSGVITSFYRCLTGFFKRSHRVAAIKRYGMERFF